MYGVHHGPGAFAAHFITRGSDVQFFGVDYVYPEKGSADLSTTTYVYFAFTGLLDPTSVEGAVSISPSVPSYTSAWNNYIELYPQNRFATNTHYTVTLATSLKSTNGTHLPAPYMLDFTTQPFMISWISPSDGSTNVHRSTSIYVSCNDVLDGETIPSAFSISPAVSGIFSISESSFSFIPSSTLAPKKAYTVTVASSLKSSSGSPLPGAMVATFTTSE